MTGRTPHLTSVENNNNNNNNKSRGTAGKNIEKQSMIKEIKIEFDRRGERSPE